MDQDIKSQIERAKELLKELEESYNSDLQTKSISEKTKNLTQEVLVKMRHVLDQSMYRFFAKIISPTLSSDVKKNVKIYFPIAQNPAGLKSRLGMGKMAALDVSNPDVYKFLESIQPYNAKFSWLGDFSKFANEKHIRLSPQEFKEENETTLSNAIHAGRGAEVKMAGCRIGDIPVNCENINTTPLDQFDPRLKVKRTTWVQFNFKGTNINVLWLCKKAVNELEKVIDKFFTLF